MEVDSRNHRPGRLVWVSLAVSFALLTLSSSALGQRQRERRAGAPQWHGDIGRFHEHDWGLWRGGHWANSRHDGRLGWWWVVGGGLQLVLLSIAGLSLSEPVGATARCPAGTALERGAAGAAHRLLVLLRGVARLLPLCVHLCTGLEASAGHAERVFFGTTPMRPHDDHCSPLVSSHAPARPRCAHRCCLHRRAFTGQLCRNANGTVHRSHAVAQQTL